MSSKKVPVTTTKDDGKNKSPKAPIEAVSERNKKASGTQRRQQLQRSLSKPHNPAKIGKANPKRDIPLFLGLVGFLLLVAYSFQGIGTEKKGKSARELHEDLRKRIEAAHAREQARKRTMECNLFLASSSIPGAELGVFAGKRYEMDEEVLHPGILYPVESDQQSDATKISVAQYGFLLKHHPHLANLEGGPIWTDTNQSNISALKATRVIEPGEELFVSFEHHPQTRLETFALPTFDDYQLADEIIQDEIKTQRKGSRAVAGRSLGVGGGGPTLLLLKRTVAKFNKNVAALLPGSPKALETRDALGSNATFSALSNRTVNYLETKGQCLDDVHVNASAEDLSEMGLFARRTIKQGNVATPVPLYARRRGSSCSATDDDSCTAAITQTDSTKHCFGHVGSSLLLCPLSPVTSIQSTSTREGANVALKWSSRHNRNDIEKLTVNDILKNSSTSLSLDLVALRPIRPGEQLFIHRDLTVQDNEYTAVDGSIYSNGWKDLAIS